MKLEKLKKSECDFGCYSKEEVDKFREDFYKLIAFFENKQTPKPRNKWEALIRFIQSTLFKFKKKEV